MPKYEITLMREVLEKACVVIEAADEAAARAAVTDRIELDDEIGEKSKGIEWVFVDVQPSWVTEVFDVTPVEGV